MSMIDELGEETAALVRAYHRHKYNKKLGKATKAMVMAYRAYLAIQYQKTGKQRRQRALEGAPVIIVNEENPIGIHKTKRKQWPWESE